MLHVIKEFIVIKGDEESGKNVENISFENLIFEVAGYNTPPTGNEPAQAAAPVDAVVTLDFAEKISISELRNCTYRNLCFLVQEGVQLIALLVKCYMHDLGAGGVKIGETVIRPDAE